MNIFNFVIFRLRGVRDLNSNIFNWFVGEIQVWIWENFKGFELFSGISFSNSLAMSTNYVVLWFDNFADSKRFFDFWSLVIWEFCLKFENCTHPLVLNSKTLYELLNTWRFCIFILNRKKGFYEKNTTNLWTSQFVLL